MKIAQQIKKIVEDEGTVGLSPELLKKFWKDMTENVFKYSKEVKKNDLGFFYDNTKIKFGGLSWSGSLGRGANDPDNDAEIDRDFFNNPEDYINDITLESAYPKDLVEMILTDYTLDREPTEEEINSAFEYLIQHLKGTEVCFYGEETAVASNGNDDEIESELSYVGVFKIEKFKYNASRDTIEDVDGKVVSLKVE